MTSNDFPSSLWQVDDAGPEHVPQIRELFQTVFNQQMSQSHWQWKYDNGRGVGVVVSSAGKIIAYYGGVERRVLCRGEAINTIQCVDTMVAEIHRGTLSKKGPFYLSVTAFLERYVGYNRPYLLAYGFPNARAMKLAERLGVYGETASLVEIAWPAQTGSEFTLQKFDFDSARHRTQLEQLWNAMACALREKIVVIRDLDYLQYRYRDHPGLNYDLDLVFCTRSENPRGLIITRKDNDRLLLLDMVAAPSEFSDLAAAGQQLAGELGCSEIYGWLTQADSHLLSDSAVIIRETEVRIPTGIYTDGPKPEELKDAWFLMSGDTDFL